MRSAPFISTPMAERRRPPTLLARPLLPFSNRRRKSFLRLVLNISTQRFFWLAFRFECGCNKRSIPALLHWLHDIALALFLYTGDARARQFRPASGGPAPRVRLPLRKDASSHLPGTL